MLGFRLVSRTANSSATGAPQAAGGDWRERPPGVVEPVGVVHDARTGRSLPTAERDERLERPGDGPHVGGVARGGAQGRLGRDGVEVDAPSAGAGGAQRTGVASDSTRGPQDDEVLGVCHGLREEGRLADPGLQPRTSSATPSRRLGPEARSRSCSCSPSTPTPQCRAFHPSSPHFWRPGPSSNVGTPRLERKLPTKPPELPTQRRNSRLNRRNSRLLLSGASTEQPEPLPGGRGGRCGPPARWVALTTRCRVVEL